MCCRTGCGELKLHNPWYRSILIGDIKQLAGGALRAAGWVHVRRRHCIAQNNPSRHKRRFRRGKTRQGVGRVTSGLVPRVFPRVLSENLTKHIAVFKIMSPASHFSYHPN